MSKTGFQPVEGGCACGAVRYRLEATPLIVHCCHCYACQRETGSAFAINVLIEKKFSPVITGKTEAFSVPTESGNPHTFFKCSKCHGAVWHEYDPPGPHIRFLPAGTLDAGHGIEPDIHIFTDSKHPWVSIPSDAKAVPQFYEYGEVWQPESLERLRLASLQPSS